MQEVVALLTEIMFLLLLASALLSGAWAFYFLVYKNRSLFNDDYFVLDLRKETRDGFELIDNRLESLEESHKETKVKIEEYIEKMQYEKE